jgi:hypothetical protein
MPTIHKIGLVLLFTFLAAVACNAWQSADAQAERTPSKTWEIAKVSAELRKGATEDESWQKAKEMAEEGWELVAVSRSTAGHEVFYFKRLEQVR